MQNQLSRKVKTAYSTLESAELLITLHINLILDFIVNQPEYTLFYLPFQCIPLGK